MKQRLDCLLLQEPLKGLLVYICNQNNAVLSFGFLLDNDKIVIPSFLSMPATKEFNVKVQCGSDLPRVVDNYKYITKDPSGGQDFVIATVSTFALNSQNFPIRKIQFISEIRNLVRNILTSIRFSKKGLFTSKYL